MSCNCCKKPEINIVRIKLLHPDAKCPVQAHPNSDAGYDVFSIDDGVVKTEVRRGNPKELDIYLYTEYRTGLAIELPIGYHCELFPRSSITKMDLMLKNSIGLIDNEYRGELIFRFHQFPMVNGTNSIYKKGDRIGQIVLRKTIHMPIMVVDELSDTSRGAGGLGSSGK